MAAGVHLAACLHAPRFSPSLFACRPRCSLVALAGRPSQFAPRSFSSLVAPRSSPLAVFPSPLNVPPGIPYSVKERQLSAVDIVLPFSPVCVIVNSLCPTIHKYILSVLRLSIEAISGSGVRIRYTPVFIDKIYVEWEKDLHPK